MQTLTLPPVPTVYLAPAEHWEFLRQELVALVHPADVAEAEHVPLTMPDLRSLRRIARLSPYGPAGRLLWIPAAERLSREVANGLLHLVEEPPAGLRIALAAERDQLLPTLRSRLRLVRYAPTAPETARRLATAPQRALLRDYLYAAPLMHQRVTGITPDTFFNLAE